MGHIENTELVSYLFIQWRDTMSHLGEPKNCNVKAHLGEDYYALLLNKECMITVFINLSALIAIKTEA